MHLLSADPVTTPACSPDGAQRNPGIDGVAGRFPRISLALHAGYWLHRMLPGCRILGQRCLSKRHSGQTQISFQTWWSDRLPAGTLLHGCPLNFQQRFLDIANVCVMAAVLLADSQT